MMEVHLKERRGGGGVEGKVVDRWGGGKERRFAPGAPSPAGSVSLASLEAPPAGLEGD